MTSDRDIERALERWFTEGPTHMPSRFLDETLERIDDLPGRPLADLRPRLRTMHFDVRFVAAAVVVLAMVGVGSAVMTRSAQVGAEPSPSPTHSFDPLAGTTPAALRSVWSSVGTRVVPFQNGNHTIQVVARTDITIAPGWIDIPVLSSDFLNFASLVRPDTLDLRASSTWPTEDCRPEEVGLYTFRLSADGGTLSLTMQSDRCVTRATILAGDWTRTDIGDLAPGPHVSALFRPFGGPTDRFSYTVPAGWRDQYECVDCVNLEPQDDSRSSRIGIYSNLTPYSEDVACVGSGPGDGASPRSIADWLAALPGVDATTPIPIAVGGLSGVQVDLSLTPGWIDPCSTSSHESHRSLFVTAEGSPALTLDGGGKARYILLDARNGRTLVIDVETQDATGWDTVASDAMPMVETFRFSR